MGESDLSQLSHNTLDPLLKNFRSSSYSSSRPASLSSYESVNLQLEKPAAPLIDRARTRLSILPTIFDSPPPLSEKSDESQLLSDSSKTIAMPSHEPSKTTGSLCSSQVYSHLSIPFDELEFPPESQQVKEVLGGTRYHIASEFIRLNSLLVRNPNNHQITGSFKSSNHSSLNVCYNKELSHFNPPMKQVYSNKQPFSPSISNYHSHYSLTTSIPPNVVYSSQLRTFDFLNPAQFKTKITRSSPNPKSTFLSDIPTGGRLFVGGFIFFPLWFIGSFLKITVSETSLIQDKTERIQREWRNWNRAMAVTCTFFIIIMISLGVAGAITYNNSHRIS